MLLAHTEFNLCAHDCQFMISKTNRSLTFGIAIAFAAAFNLRSEVKIPEQCKQSGFAIGCQAYTFNHFSVFEAIEKTAEAGGKVIEFYPGQKLTKEEPKTAWDHRASEEIIRRVEEKLNQHGIKAVNYGVVGGADAAEWRQIFEFAKRLKLYAVTTEDVSKLDLIE